jgi:hypothetical protein
MWHAQPCGLEYPSFTDAMSTLLSPCFVCSGTYLLQLLLCKLGIRGLQCDGLVVCVTGQVHPNLLMVASQLLQGYGSSM